MNGWDFSLCDLDSRVFSCCSIVCCEFFSDTPQTFHQKIALVLACFALLLDFSCVFNVIVSVDKCLLRNLSSSVFVRFFSNRWQLNIRFELVLPLRYEAKETKKGRNYKVTAYSEKAKVNSINFSCSKFQTDFEMEYFCQLNFYITWIFLPAQFLFYLKKYNLARSKRIFTLVWKFIHQNEQYPISLG